MESIVAISRSTISPRGCFSKVSMRAGTGGLSRSGRARVWAARCDSRPRGRPMSGSCPPRPVDRPPACLSRCRLTARAAPAASAPATTIVTSPRGGSAAARAASSARVPRQISSCSFVSSRHSAAARSRPQVAARSASVAAARPGASNRTVVRSSRRCAPGAAVAPCRAAAGTPRTRSARGQPARDERRQNGRGTGDGHDLAAPRQPRRPPALRPDR